MRIRFTKAERAAFTPGTAIEWRNVSHWHPGTVLTGVVREADGWEYLGLTNHAATRTCHPGQYLTGSPTAVRLAVSP